MKLEELCGFYLAEYNEKDKTKKKITFSPIVLSPVSKKKKVEKEETSASKKKKEVEKKAEKRRNTSRIS
jgi:hypothetical protein